MKKENEIINLSKFVKSNLFINKIDKIYDSIIIESKKTIKWLKTNWDIFFLDNLKNRISDFFNDINAKYEKILLILDTMNIDFFLKNNINLKNISIINCNTWLSSLWIKIKYEINDIKNIPNNFTIYEPYSLEHLIKITNLKKNNKYIKLSANYLPEIFPNMKKIGNLEFFDNKNNEYKNIIISSNSLLLHNLQVIQNLKEKNIIFNMFWLTNYFIKDNENFSKIIKKSNNIFIITEINYKEFQENIKNRLKKITNSNIVFITPNYWNITTILNDYKYLQCDFEIENIENIIKKNLI